MSSSLPCLLAVLALVCIGYAEAGPAESLPIRSLAKGAFSSIQDPRQEVVKDQASWEKFWAAHTVRTRDPKRCPEVDFSKEMVIAVTLGKQRSGGYSVEITEVKPSHAKLSITVTTTKPVKGRMSIQALTAPYHLVAVPKSDLEPIFQEQAPVF